MTALSKEITQARIDRYADASGDHNPVHVNEAFARATPFGGTIAHGMLVLASISELLAREHGRAWLERGRLKVRFRAPARPGDTITAEARPSAQPGAYAVEVRNQAGEALITGTAEVPPGG